MAHRTTGGFMDVAGLIRPTLDPIEVRGSFSYFLGLLMLPYMVWLYVRSLQHTEYSLLKAHQRSAERPHSGLPLRFGSSSSSLSAAAWSFRRSLRKASPVLGVIT